jgi:serine/threonine-protein kinase
MNRLQEGFVLGGRYRLDSRIASGGMADVWAGTDQVLRRTVAVKIMRPDTAHEELFALRFRDEAVHSAGLNHTNIATVFDYGEDDGLAYLVQELVTGQPLSRILGERGPLPPSEVRSIIGQAALALAVAHAERVVHRDVKPANILVREDGLVKLTDFGIARALDASGHTQHGEMLGTPNYISPEQAMGEPATGSSDLYALGVVAHEMLSGQRPFDRGTPIATALSHVNEEPPPLPDDVPEDLAQVINDCLEKDPANRPPNAATVAMRLGMGDQELMGLALGLATALNDNPDELIPEVLGSDTVDPADAAAERAEAETALMPSPLTD